MAKQYAAAGPLCDAILRFEPGNSTALQFRPLLGEARGLLSAEAEEREGEGDGSVAPGSGVEDEGRGSTEGEGDAVNGGGARAHSDEEGASDGDSDDAAVELEVPARYAASGVTQRPLGNTDALRRSIAATAGRPLP